MELGVLHLVNNLYVFVVLLLLSLPHDTSQKRI
jgi:hypothetical protein